MRKLRITEEFRTVNELVMGVQHIVSLIETGFNCGIHPSWSLEGEDEPDEDDESDVDDILDDEVDQDLYYDNAGDFDIN